MSKHMDRAFVIFEHEGQELRLSVTEKQYREFVKSNNEPPHRLICPDPFCGGAVHAHTEAKNRRTGADHDYTEAGFSHNKNTATDDCKYSHKNDLRFADLKANPMLAETVEKVRNRFAEDRLAILEDLQRLFGPKEDCEPHFEKMKKLLREHEYYSIRSPIAPLAYATRRPPFNMELHNGNVRRVVYMQDGQQSDVFKSIRGHNRTEWIPQAVQLVYSPKLLPVPTYRFEIDVDHGATAILRDMTLAKHGPKSVRPDKRRIIPVSLEPYKRRGLKLG